MRTVTKVGALLMAGWSAIAHGEPSKVLPPGDLLGRTLGTTIAFARECLGLRFPHSEGRSIYLVKYIENLIKFSDKYADSGRKEFLFELYHSSIKTHDNCDAIRSEEEAYWLALEAYSLRKDGFESLVRLFE